MHWGLVLASVPYLLQGFRATLLLSATVLVTGTAVGALWGLLRVVPVPALQRVVDSTQPDMVKQAASKAIDAIRK